MIRLLKLVGTANLAVAILIVIGYQIWGLLFGSPIDQLFLGNGPAYPATPSGPEIPAWAYGLIVESAVVAIFIFCRCTERDMKGHRLFCGVVGLVGLWGLLLSALPQFADKTLPVPFLRIDRALAWYVWCSHLIYALIGPNDD